MSLSKPPLKLSWISTAVRMTACSWHLSIEHRERHPEMIRHLTRWHPVPEPSCGRRDCAPCHAAWTPDPPAPSLGRIREQCDLNKHRRRNPHLRQCPSYILRLYCTSLPRLTSSAHPISCHPTWTSGPRQLQTDHHGPAGPEGPFSIPNMTRFRECGHQHVQSIEHILSE